jgi:DNA-binding MurR/RpiR family transcriptional regulator
LNEATNLLASANVVHVIGLGRSFSVASYIAYIFEKMEVPAVLHTSLGKLDNRHAVRKGDAVLAFTFAPYSSPTIELVQDVASRNIPIVAVTDSAIGPLAKFRPTTLLVSEVDFGAFRSPAATLCLATALAVSVGTAKPAAT